MHLSKNKPTAASPITELIKLGYGIRKSLIKSEGNNIKLKAKHQWRHKWSSCSCKSAVCKFPKQELYCICFPVNFAKFSSTTFLGNSSEKNVSVTLKVPCSDFRDHVFLSISSQEVLSTFVILSYSVKMRWGQSWCFYFCALYKFSL